MFSYCTRNLISITSTLGNFLSNNVCWTDNNGDLYSTDIINSWNRMDIAEAYIDNYVKKYDKHLDTIGGEKNKDLFIRELSIKIDEFIPKRYFCKYNEIYNKNKSIDFNPQFISKDKHDITRNLIYVFDINNKKNKDHINSNPVTNKQLIFLKDLLLDSGYILKSDNLTSIDASNLINFLLGKSDEPPNLFNLVEFDI